MESKDQFYPFSYQGKHQQAAQQWTDVITQITLGYHHERLLSAKDIDVKKVNPNREDIASSIV